jgi:hypothetical protein
MRRIHALSRLQVSRQSSSPRRRRDQDLGGSTKESTMFTARATRRKLRKILPYQVAALVSAAVAITFAVAASAIAGPPDSTTEAGGQALPPISVSAFEYFPAAYQNQATEAEPQPPTF